MAKENNLSADRLYIPELLKDIENEQLRNRLQHVLDTYAYRALLYKRLFYILSTITITFPALVTVVNTCSGNAFSVTDIIESILCACSAIAAGLLGIANIRENWISYRTNCELLKEEVFKYITQTENYKNLADTEREQLLVSNILKLYHQESVVWKDINSKSRRE